MGISEQIVPQFFTIPNTVAIVCILLLAGYIPGETKILGRPFWHKNKRLIDYELDGEETSMQIFDIYTFSHITHGILLYFMLKYLGYKPREIIYLVPILEIIWEWIENTPFIINKYRSKTEFQEYKGDSIANIAGDTIATILGVYLTRYSSTLGILYMLFSELLLAPFNANFLHLSIGSLIQK